LTFLKNALGNEIAFAVEKGGGARANLLSQRHPNPNRKRRKLMDAAATRIATKRLLDDSFLLANEKRVTNGSKPKQEGENGGKESSGRKADLHPGIENMDWLSHNISREGLDMELDRLRKQDMEGEASGEADIVNFNESNDEIPRGTIVLSDLFSVKEGMMDEDACSATFQALYTKEMNRQAELMHLENDAAIFSSPPKGSILNSDDKSLSWEDG
jgi:hypothetical protein